MTAAKNYDDEDEDYDDEYEVKKPICPPCSVIFKRIKKRVVKILDSIYYIISMLIVTLYILFVSDIQSAFLTNEFDDTLTNLQVLCLALFVAELMLNCIFFDNYNWTFYFWLDLISTISLITEIDFMFNGIIDLLDSSGDETNSTTGSNGSNQQKTTAKFTKATKTMKVTRIVRIVRIIRLIRIVKLYKTAMLARKRLEETRLKMIQEEARKEEEQIKEKDGKFLFKDKKIKNDNFILNKKRKAIRDKGKKFSKFSAGKKNFQLAKEERKIEILKLRENNLIEEFENNKDLNIDEEELKRKEQEGDDGEEDYDKPEEKKEDITKESNLSKLISESITKKVIILILGMVVGMPFFDSGIYVDSEQAYYPRMIAEYLEKYIDYKNTPNFNFEKTNLILQKYIETESDPSFPIINITYNEELYYKNNSINSSLLRDDEVRMTNGTDFEVIVYYSMQKDTKLTGLLDILKTIFIGGLIVYAAITLEDDVKTLVLGPMEIIIEIIEMVSKDPQKAKNPENFKSGIKNLVNNIEVEDSKDKKLAQRKKDYEKYEVVKVQQSIIKISTLLVVGFGDAGCEMIKTIIGENNEIDLLKKGKKIKAIFSFCNIVNLDKIVEVTQDKSSLYVNRISDYVHTATDKFGGTINKNTGNEIFCVWNFKTLKEFKQGKLYNKDVKQMADLALCSIFESIVQIKSRKKITEWRFDEDINKVFKKFESNLEFGLHIGGAIEGIIGSKSKLEATYLSRNVSIAHKILELTKVYGVEILLTDSFYTQLSEEMKEVCRLIDVIKLKDTSTYFKLYTVDLNSELPINDEEDQIDALPHKERQLKHLTKKERIRKFLNGSTGGKDNKISSYSFSKQGYKDLLSSTIPADFFRFFDKGINDYIIGDWKSAKSNFEQCNTYYAYDKPLKFIYNYMKQFKFKAPKKGPNRWQGKRELP